MKGTKVHEILNEWKLKLLTLSKVKLQSLAFSPNSPLVIKVNLQSLVFSM
jgi:hypothetical protein